MGSAQASTSGTRSRESTLTGRNLPAPQQGHGSWSFAGDGVGMDGGGGERRADQHHRARGRGGS